MPFGCFLSVLITFAVFIFVFAIVGSAVTFAIILDALPLILVLIGFYLIFSRSKKP